MVFCFATGSLSQKEHFFDPAKMSKNINGYTGETCCTYNMLKLSRHLFCWNTDPSVADYYERALYNHILAQQDPESCHCSADRIRSTARPNIRSGAVSAAVSKVMQNMQRVFIIMLPDVFL